MDDENVYLTIDEAIAMLPEEDSVHTFIGSTTALLGADWNRQAIIEALNEAPEGGIRLAGENATRMGHGLCFQHVYDGRGAVWVFVQTKEVQK